MASRVITAICSGALLLAACAAAPTDPTAAAQGKRVEGVKLSAGVAQIAKDEGKVDLAKDERVACEKYTPIGSHRTQYRCLTKNEKAASEEANQREMRKIEAPPPSGNSSIIR